MPIRAADQTLVPVTYNLEVTNPLNNQVTLTSVQIETVGLSGSYSMKPVRHSFTEVIPAHGTALLAIRAWVQPLQMNEQGKLSSPVMLRGTAHFTSMGKALHSGFAQRLQQ